MFICSELILQARMQKAEITREDNSIFTMSKITDLGFKVRSHIDIVWKVILGEGRFSLSQFKKFLIEVLHFVFVFL